MVGQEHELEEFYRWLRADVDVARAATVRAGTSSGAGHMGVFEVISMTLGNVTGLTSLAFSFAAWCRTRKSPPTFRFDQGTRSVTLTVLAPGEEQRIVVELGAGDQDNGHSGDDPTDDD